MKQQNSKDTPEIGKHRRAVRANPRDARSHALLGLALQRAGRLEEAVASQRRALALEPSMLGLHAVIAPALLDLGQHAAAADSYRRAIAADGRDAELHRGLCDALYRDGQHEAAVASALAALALAPDSIPVHLSLAAAQHAWGNFEQAAVAFRKVLELAPDHSGARMDLGRTLMTMKRFDQAAACFEQVLERDPVHLQAWIALGVCLREDGRKEDAVACYRRGLERLPGNVRLIEDLSACQQKIGDFDGARLTLLEGLAGAPDNESFLRGVGLCEFELGNWEGAERHWRRVLELYPSPSIHSALLFLLSHSLSDPVALTREHKRFSELWETPLLPLRRPHENTRDPGRPLRVGFVSPDMHNHAVSRFILPIFTELANSSTMSLHIYYNNNVDDHITKELRACAASWHAIDTLDDAAAEKLIRADGIDILIDLAGHSARNRLTLFARKPAPIQASWIGYAGTTGLQGMDYYFGDQFYVPEGRYDDQFSEQIVRMPLVAPFLPDPVSPPLSPLPALKNGYITFGSFHRANKISREVVALWAKMLRAIPDSKMLLGGLRAQEPALVGWFEEQGIDRSRLILRQRTHMRGYLEQHAEVDICFSPFPYTGGTTVCHALWMGVPTLTTIGPTNPSHAALAYLAHLGLSSFLAENDDTFVKLGVYLSQNLPTLAALRASMRERFTSSVVGYPGIVAASLELTLRRLWEHWCAGLPPQPIQVRLAELVPPEAPQDARQSSAGVPA